MSFTLGTLALEKLLDMLLYSLLFVLALLLIPLPGWVSGSTYLLAAATGIGFAAALVIAFNLEAFARLVGRLFTRLPPAWAGPVLPRLQSAVSSLKVLQQRRLLLALAFWSALIWGTALLNNQLALLALGLHLPATAPLLILIVLQAGVTILTVPARLGIFEYLCILTLARFGVGETLGLSYGFLLHAIVFVPVTLSGLLSLPFLGSPAVPRPGDGVE
jgi:uncharacterized membrane protein YbhN (UPF0104 family)